GVHRRTHRPAYFIALVRISESFRENIVVSNMPKTPPTNIATGVRNASWGRYIGLVNPFNKLLSVFQLPGSIINPKIDTIITIVIQDAILRNAPNRMCFSFAFKDLLEFFHVR